MAWTSPRTWNAGETVTANLMNTHLRDNLNFLKTNVTNSAYFKTVLYSDFAPRATSGTGETDASSWSLAAATLDTDGMALRIKIWGKTGASGTHTFKFYWNGATYHTGVVTAVSGVFAGESYIMRTAAATQSACSWTGKLAGGINTATPVAFPTLDSTVWDSGAPMNATLSGAVAVKTTVTASATTITQLGYIAELLVPTAAAAA